MLLSFEGYLSFMLQLKLNFFNILRNNLPFTCGGCRARLKAMDLGSIPAGVRAFESHPPHSHKYTTVSEEIG